MCFQKWRIVKEVGETSFENDKKVTMLNACILIRFVPRKGKDILEKVKKFKEVKEAFIVFGRYDIAAFIEAPDYETVSNLSLK